MLGDLFEKLGKFEIMGIPVGKGVLFIFGVGLAEVVIRLVQAKQPKIPAIGVAAAGAYLPTRVPAVRQFLGDAGTGAVQLGFVVGGLEAQFALSAQIQNQLQKLLGKVPGVAAPAAAVAPAAAAPTVRYLEVPGMAPVPVYTFGSPPLYESDAERKLRATLGV